MAQRPDMASTAESSRLGARRDGRPKQRWGALHTARTTRFDKGEMTSLTVGQRWSHCRLGAGCMQRRGRGSRRRGPGSASLSQQRHAGAASSNGSRCVDGDTPLGPASFYPLLASSHFSPLSSSCDGRPGKGENPNAAWLARGARSRGCRARLRRRRGKDGHKVLPLVAPPGAVTWPASNGGHLPFSVTGRDKRGTSPSRNPPGLGHGCARELGGPGVPSVRVRVRCGAVRGWGEKVKRKEEERPTCGSHTLA
jgi:hypothetical protein